MSRLEEIKEHTTWTVDNGIVPRLDDADLGWLIQQAERVDELEKDIERYWKSCDQLEEQNQHYKQAIKRSILHADESIANRVDPDETIDLMFDELKQVMQEGEG